MQVVELHMDGRSQAVRLPEKFCINDDKVFINKIGNAVVLIPYHDPWRSLFNSLDKFSEDFMEAREQPKGQVREKLFE